MTIRAKLALEDGSVFEGTSFGADGEKVGEVVFNTAMTGYQEILTDPSYKGQIVTMTYPLIGNYGVNLLDVESAHPWVEGFVVREVSKIYSNFRATDDISSYLKKHNVVAIEGVDTRAVTKKLRVDGSLSGVLSNADLSDQSLVEKARRAPKMVGLDLAQKVTCSQPRHWKEFVNHGANGSLTKVEPRWKVALLDYGVKYNIVRSLVANGCDVTIFPAFAKSDDVLAFKPDGICLSNGPGDPAAVTYAIECVKNLLGAGLPIFGICLGHQILSLALGAKVYKLKFGHHGANHPVKNLATGKIEITSQNHGFAVDGDSLDKIGVAITHINLNDQTIEGFAHKSRPVFSVQYHPEASPGPHDANYLFGKFCKMMEAK